MTRLNANLRRMAVVLASVIAVLGTLGGATASYLFQRKISERNESKARGERLRQERLAAYSSFAAAVMDLRGIQYDRGYSRMTPGNDQLDRSSIRAESTRLRSVAWTAFYRFKLASPDHQLTTLATRAVEEALDVADASNKVDLKTRSEQARARIDELINTAASTAYNNRIGRRPALLPPLETRSAEIGKLLAWCLLLTTLRHG
jgi:hypothetical protein